MNFEFVLGFFFGILIACLVHRAHKYEKKIGRYIKFKRLKLKRITT